MLADLAPGEEVKDTNSEQRAKAWRMKMKEAVKERREHLEDYRIARYGSAYPAQEDRASSGSSSEKAVFAKLKSDIIKTKT